VWEAGVVGFGAAFPKTALGASAVQIVRRKVARTTFGCETAGQALVGQEAVVRVAQIPGFGVDSAQQIIAAVGVDAPTFPSPGEFSSWAGVCPGSNISAGENPSARSPKGNRLVRKILTQAAQAAVRKKGGHFQAVFRRFVPKLGYKGVTWAVAHRLACLVWKILHNGVRYITPLTPNAPVEGEA
jgi:transposase